MEKRTLMKSEEFKFYRSYKLMNLNKKLVKDVHEAVGICEGFIQAVHYIPCDTEEELEAWQYLIDTGVAWQLQGWFGRQAQFLIDNKLCKEKVVN